MIRKKEAQALYERILSVRKSVNALESLTHEEQLEKILDVLETLLVEVISIDKQLYGEAQ